MSRLLLRWTYLTSNLLDESSPHLWERVAGFMAIIVIIIIIAVIRMQIIIIDIDIAVVIIIIIGGYYERRYLGSGWYRRGIGLNRRGNDGDRGWNNDRKWNILSSRIVIGCSFRVVIHKEPAVGCLVQLHLPS